MTSACLSIEQDNGRMPSTDWGGPKSAVLFLFVFAVAVVVIVVVLHK